MPKISVIIPIYNVEKYLRECLDSVINQTLKDIEIICVNDGSTDGSLAILEEYEKKDERIKIISQKNAGLSAARNTGLENISGEYCYFLDSDDFIDIKLFETALNIFSKTDIDYFCFGSKAFADNNNIIQDVEGMNEYLRVKRSGIYTENFEIGQCTNIQVWNKIFKTSIIKNNNIKFIEGLLYEDIYFTWYYRFLTNNAYFDTNIYHHYRVRNNSIMEETTRNKSYKNTISHMLNWNELMKSVSKNSKLFSENYENLLDLLESYEARTKELCPIEELDKITKIKLQYLNELRLEKRKIKTSPLKYIFSIRKSRNKKYKTITILGIKINIKNKGFKNGEDITLFL